MKERQYQEDSQGTHRDNFFGQYAEKEENSPARKPPQPWPMGFHKRPIQERDQPHTTGKRKEILAVSYIGHCLYVYGMHGEQDTRRKRCSPIPGDDERHERGDGSVE